MKVKMWKFIAICLLILFGIESLYFCASDQKYSGQEFFQTSRLLDLNVYGNGEFSSDVLSALNSPKSKLPVSHLHFEPPFLDFKEHHIGEPRLEQVLVFNTHTSQPLQLLSISSTAPHFHCSFFKTETVPPGGNATFDVVFLATRAGTTENTLYIRTSAGQHRYQVFGVGLPSPYRVRAMLGARIPLNASFAPSLQLYNPNSEPLQVTEMFSSSADLHLELPSGIGINSWSSNPRTSSSSSTAKLDESPWRIPPYETRTLMRLRLIGRSAANHSAFVRLRTSLGGPGLVLPVQVQVSGQPGLYSCSDRLYFGQMLSSEQQRRLQLRVTSLYSEPTLVSSAELDSPNPAVQLLFRPVQVLPGPARETPVAIVVFDPAKAADRRLHWTGNIILRGGDSRQLLSVPYEASLLHGALTHAENATVFNTGGKSDTADADASEGRPVPIKNSFDRTVAVTGVELPQSADGLLSVVGFKPPALIPAGKTAAPFRLRLNASAAAGRQAELRLTVRSNATAASLPVLLHTGLLTLLPGRPQPEPGSLDLGTVATDAVTSLEFALRNDNPLPVSLESVSVHSSLAELRRADSGAGRLGPGESAAFVLTVRPPADFYGVVIDDVAIRTERGATQSVQYVLRTADGVLTPVPARPLLEAGYPGRPACRWLSVHSSFPEPLRLRQLSFLPPDPRFHFQLLQPARLAEPTAGLTTESAGSEQLFGLMKPFQTATIGKLCFDHRRVCGNDCYVGFSTSSSTGIEWLAGLSLGRRTLRSDQYQLARLRSRWSALSQADQRLANVTVQLVTEHSHLFLFEARASLVWPSLYPSAGWAAGGGSGGGDGGYRLPRLELPVTQVGKASTADLILENPTDKTVLAHLVPLSAYPGQASALSHLGLEAALQDATLDSSASDSAASSARSIRLTPTPRWATEYRRLPVGYPDIHPDTLAVLIRPRQRAHLPVTFRPTESGEFRALFLLRNNLTGVEPLLAVGRGARVELRASADSMEFGLAGATGLEPPCQRVPPSIWRQLTIVNPGPLTVDSGPPIVGRDASGCSDAGFMVAPCAPIRLGPNESLHMAVTFTPDLCQLRTTRELRLVGGALRVVLRGGLTPTQVAACSARLPRPPWETPLQTGLVGAVLAAALWAIMSACVTADRLSSASAAAAASSSSASANSASATSAAPPTALPQTEQSASKSTPSVVAVPDRSADSGLFSRLTAWLPCWWRRQRRAGRAGGAADGSLSVGGSSARGQASVGRHAAAASARSSVGLQQAAASTTASTGQPTVRRSRKLATAAAASQSTPSPSSTSADVGSPPLTAAAIRTPQFEPIAFPQIDRRGKPLPTKSKPSASKSQQQKAAPDLSGQQPSLAANGGRKASAGAAGQDQLRRQQQRQVQQHQEDCSTSSSNGSASDASSWETAGSAFQRVGAGNQRSVKAASSGFGSLAQQAQQQQQSAAVPTVSVRAVPLQPLQCKQQPKTSVVKPMMTHPRLRREEAEEANQRIGQQPSPQQQQQQQQMKPIAAGLYGPGHPLRQHQYHQQNSHHQLQQRQRQQQQQQRQQQQQLHQVAGPPTGLVAPWCQERPLSELAQVTLQKSQRMFHYEELRRQQLLQPATTQQQQQEARQESGWRGSEAVAWPEPTLSNRSLWGGFLDSGSSGGPNDPDDDENAGAVVGSSSDPVARMLLGETLLWDSPAPASSGWACFPDRQD
ncbi:hypothetical protein BOX15_Mlig014963g2 [Macrostomum lignano]|uniref:Uncharacterized protein n=1 Tax=Macrostomum lignano TaxID=282301 RepID=A0A267ECH9_9PLAT|nr:hypothetical protein BOX15_Mlig014963g2 [Macrostomum lignano]